MARPKKHYDEERAAARRRQVLDAAEECFVRGGFHSTGMAEISRASGMSVGHIYNYFDNKESVIIALVDREMMKVLTRFREIGSGRERFVEELKTVLRERIAEDSDTCQAAFIRDLTAEMGRNEALTTAVREFDRRIREELGALCRVHKPDLSEARVKARIEVLLLLLHGYGMRCICSPQIDAEAYTAEVDALIDTLFAA